jgi:NitT/TauT family transport system substrate-binding protein
MLRRAIFAVGMLLSVTAAAAAQSTSEIRFGDVRAGPLQWPFFIAQREGFFKQEGIAISTVSVGNPANIEALLDSGEIQMTSVGGDVCIGAVARGRAVKVVGVELNTSPYQLMAVPAITRFDQLKGKSIAIGPLRSGDTTGVFYRMIGRGHLALSDFELLSGGTSGTRLEALTIGNAQAALLSQPLDLIAQQRGMRVLVSGHDVVGNEWMSMSLAVNTRWAAANHGAIVHLLRATLKAIDFAYTHEDEAVADLVAATGVDPAIARANYDLYFRNWKAFDPKLRLSAAALKNVEESMIQARVLDRNVPSAKAVFDSSYLMEALR